MLLQAGPASHTPPLGRRGDQEKMPQSLTDKERESGSGTDKEMEEEVEVDKLKNQLAEKDQALKMMSGKIEKLEIEILLLQQNVEVAHITIAKNLEKI